ncbi:MAG: TlpA family protein disulfide reductase [Bacteroidetes bacterium]|nr:TlpA family protein disulfide reductase [Bacteroidota bacterium]
MKAPVLCLLILSFLISGLIRAEEVIVSGKAPGAEGRIIRLIVHDDQITFREKTLASARIDLNSRFVLIFDLKEIAFAYLAIDLNRAEWFIEPGNKYQVAIAPHIYDDFSQVNPFAKAKNLSLLIISGDDSGLNREIGDFNDFYHGFILRNFNLLYKDRNRKQLDSFMTVSRVMAAQSALPYVRDYIRYRGASVELLAKSAGIPSMMKKYILQQPILFNHVEYMDFFNQFFDKYLTATSLPLRHLLYREIIAEPEAYKELITLMARDTLLKDMQLRELVLLKGLYEFKEEPAYKKKDLVRVVAEISKKSSFQEIRHIAGNVHFMLTHLAPGSEAPTFSLEKDGKPFSLSSLKGKWVLLNFWTTYCMPCLTELEFMKMFSPELRNKIVMISISADKEAMTMEYFLKSKEFPWTFIHMGNHFEILEDYNVKSYPVFVLIDPDGNIVSYPAPMPGEGLQELMMKGLSEEGK